MKRNNQSELTLSILDQSLEIGTAQFWGVAINAGNWTAQEALMDALKAAVVGLMSGDYVARSKRTYRINNFNPTPDATGVSEREEKWLVRYKDSSSGNPYSVEIPCADPSLKLVGVSPERIDTSKDEYGDFVEAFEDYMVSPEGNAAEVIEILWVTRKA